MAMPTFDIARRDADALRDRFDPWRKRVIGWDAMVYPQHSVTPHEPYQIEDQRFTGGGRPGRPNDAVHSEFLSPFVKTAVDTYINRMQRGLPVIEVPSSHKTEQDVRNGSMLELFVHGVIRYLNTKVGSTGMGTGWLRQIYASAACPGKVVGKVQWLKDGTIDWPILDPYNIYHDFSSSPRRFVHEYLDDPQAVQDFVALLPDVDLSAEGRGALAEAKRKKKDGGIVAVTVTDWWLEDKRGVYNAMMVDGHPLLLRKSAFKRLPFIIVSMNTMPRRYQRVSGGAKDAMSADFISRHAEPIFASLETTMTQFNEVMSLYLDALNFMVNPVLVIKSMRGDVTIGNKRLKPGDRIPLTTENFIDVLRGIGEQIPQIDGLIQQLRTDMEHAFPSALRGLTASSAESGFLYTERTDQSKNAIVEHVNGPAVFINMGAQELIQQFREAKGEITLDGHYPRGERQGQFYELNFSYKDLPRSTAMNVVMQPAIPENEAQAVNMAVQLKQSGIAVSDFWLMEHPLRIQDPAAEIERWEAQQLSRMPAIMDINGLQAFALKIREIEARARFARSQGRTDNAEALEREVEIAKLRLEALERQLTGGGGTTTEQLPTQGNRPEAISPEQTTQNPDMMALAAGRQSSSTQGRPGPRSRQERQRQRRA